MGSSVVPEYDVVIVGGGVIGASVAYYLSRENFRVLVLERRSIGCEASGSNAGLVSATGGTPDRRIIPYREAGLARVVRLATELGDGFELSIAGRLTVALSDDEMELIQEEVDERRGYGQDIHLLTREEVLELEPALVGGAAVGGAIAPGDGHINPFLLTYALVRAALRLGATVRTRATVTGLIRSGQRITGVRVGSDEVRARNVVLANGAWLEDLTAPLGLPKLVEPVRGQMMVTQAIAPITSRVIHGIGLGIRQTSSGNFVIGSNRESVGFIKATTAIIGKFAEKASQMVPALAHVPVIRAWSGLRPMPPDRFPLIGPVSCIPGLWLAAGHGSSGLTWAALTGEMLAAMMAERPLPIDGTPVSPDRFLHGR